MRSLYEISGPNSSRPAYPAAYHGPGGGEGRQFALGLSLAGSAGDQHVLDCVCTYGNLKQRLATAPSRLIAGTTTIITKVVWEA